ncbi:MAG: hypothetical protein LBR17_05460 [Bacteroidales bacterium]|jgi:hypothetical protein|nr:hypothetical protein [Bacteroidales bacterium]
MDKDYILRQLDKWETDLADAYSKEPQDSVRFPISRKIINKLIAYSRISEYCQTISDVHKTIPFN